MAKETKEQKKSPVALLTPAQVAEMLGVGEATLAVWRSTHRYPLRYVKIGGLVRYRPDDIERFLDERTHSGESDEDSHRTSIATIATKKFYRHG